MSLKQLFTVIACVVALASALTWCTGRAAQVDPDIQNRVVSAAVQIALTADVSENGKTTPEFFPVGSGTVISENGLVLTNFHVVDMNAAQERFDQWEQDSAAAGAPVTFDLERRGVMILTAQDGGPPEPTYLANIVTSDAGLDLAVLQIVARLEGPAALPITPQLPYVAIGDSDAISLADPIDIYSYPQAGGGSLTYTTGVVSGFNFEPGAKTRAWITTDATLSGGSSGGTAVNRRGQLVGVPTQGSALDCRPFDVNGDGLLDARDGGCIPVGGSIGQIRPINLAWPLLEQAGLRLDGTTTTVAATSAPPTTGRLAKDGLPGMAKATPPPE